MALTEEQEAALTLLAGADPKDVTAGLKSKANGIFQGIFDQGYKKAEKLLSTDSERAEGERDKALDRVKALEADLAKARSGNPDVETVRQEHKAEVKRLEEQHKQDRQALEDKITGMRKAGIASQLMALVTDPEVGGIRPSFAANYLRDPRWLNRIALDEKDPERFDVLQEGRKIPIVADDDTPKGMLTALAKELRKWAETNEPDAVRVPVDGGTGLTGGDRRGPQDYDPVADGKARGEAAKNGGLPEDLHKLALR